MKLRFSVVSSPCCIPQEEGVGKSSLCQQFIYGRQVRVKKRWSESEWESCHINKDHFLYWGSIPLRLPNGVETIIRIVEQTTIWRTDQDIPYPTGALTPPKQAAQTCLPSEGKTCSFPEQVSLYAHIDKRIIKSNGRAANEEDMCFPHQEFVDEGISGFLCLIDPTFQGDRMSRQIQFLKTFVHLVKQTNRRIVFVLPKCDLASERQLIDARHIVRNKLKHQAPILETSTVEMHNVTDAFVTLAQRCSKTKPIIQALTWQQHSREKLLEFSRQISEFRDYLVRLVEDSSWTWEEFWQQLKSSSQSFLAANIQEGELKRLFCLHILELKLKEAGGRYLLTPEDKTYRRLTSSQATENSKSYQEFLFNSIKAHPDLTPNYSKDDYSHYASVDAEMRAGLSPSLVFSPPPLPPRSKEFDDLSGFGSPILAKKGMSKLFSAKKLRKTMSWGGKSPLIIDNPSRPNENILAVQSLNQSDHDVNLFNFMLSTSHTTCPLLEIPADKDDTFRRRAKTTSSGKYLHRPLPPSPSNSRIDRSALPGCRTSMHSRSRSDQLSIIPANLSFPDLSRICVDHAEPAPYLDPRELKLHTLPRFRNSQASVDEGSIFSPPYSMIKRDSSFQGFASSLDPLISPLVSLSKRDASVQTYQRGEKRRESRWESYTSQLTHRKRDTSTSCTCIQEYTNEQDSGTASFICTTPLSLDPQSCDQECPGAVYDVLEPV